ncbi:hypothetical protein NC653_029666 [Populus alba x Populus x berolinensis]|uniref:Uncharacterized protein n=1 Tax=Populus alba x Populus x berolinensis TaxID=444605 RepID=A0AAD6M338_9ROSI|nr:hypothetical protein NC653_029666 [Populus alba x Populus x berolinensis]
MCSDRKAMTSTNLLHEVEMTCVVSSNQEFVHRINGENVETPPYVPKQFDRCAVIGNSGDLLKTKFGKEIDDYDVVIRENGVPVENYTEFVGKKSSFHLLNRGSAKALDKVVELDETRKELSNEKSERPFSSAFLAGLEHLLDQQLGTGLEAPEFALSICESVDMHGFTVKPGYKEWARYSSESRQGHTPLHYQTLPS